MTANALEARNPTTYLTTYRTDITFSLIVSYLFHNPKSRIKRALFTSYWFRGLQYLPIQVLSPAPNKKPGKRHEC